METQSPVTRINHYELQQELHEKERLNPSVSNLMSLRENMGCVFDRVGTNPFTNQPVYGFRKVSSADYLPKEAREEPIFEPRQAPRIIVPSTTKLTEKMIFIMLNRNRAKFPTIDALDQEYQRLLREMQQRK